jgi:hypothetical protein
LLTSGSVLKITEVGIWGYFFPLYRLHKFGQHWFGYNLGDFFTNSFGHPETTYVMYQIFRIEFKAIYENSRPTVFSLNAAASTAKQGK